MTGSRSVFVLGGARSGKSRFAEKLVEESGLAPVYVATAQAFDDEMVDRIEEHRLRRGDRWRTVEAPLALCDTLVSEVGPDSMVLVDCLTLWLTNLMISGATLEAECDRLAEFVASNSAPLVLVSNEVGLGIVPDSPMGRGFRDAAGRLNQAIAQACDEVYFLAAGLPMRLKPSPVKA